MTTLPLPGPDVTVCPFPSKPLTLGEVWRCPDCAALWRLGLACTLCDRTGGPPSPYEAKRHEAAHVHGLRWRPAGWLIRWRAWRARRELRAWHRRLHATG